MNYLKTYLIAGGVYWIVDFIWLAFAANNFYQRQLGTFLKDKINIPAAIIFYSMFPIGVIIFAVIPGVKENSLVKSLILGALFGFYTYATYDLSNYITLRGWPLKVVIVDILWGIFVSTLVAWIGYKVTI